VVTVVSLLSHSLYCDDEGIEKDKNYMKSIYTAILSLAIVSIFSLGVCAQGNGLSNGVGNGSQNGSANGLPNGTSNGSQNGYGNGMPNGTAAVQTGGQNIRFATKTRAISVSIDPVADTPERVRKQRRITSSLSSSNNAADQEIHNYVTVVATRPSRRIKLSKKDR